MWSLSVFENSPVTTCHPVCQSSFAPAGALILFFFRRVPLGPFTVPPAILGLGLRPSFWFRLRLMSTGLKQIGSKALAVSKDLKTRRRLWGGAKRRGKQIVEHRSGGASLSPPTCQSCARSVRLIAGGCAGHTPNRVAMHCTESTHPSSGSNRTPLRTGSWSGSVRTTLTTGYD